jgi:predicted small lipoprotein YifL
MRAPRPDILRNLTLGVILAAGSVACGQRGPLVLPEEARPVQRIEVPPPPPQSQSQPQSPAPAPAPAPEKQEDERKNER